MTCTFHKCVWNANAAPNATQYTKNNKYNVKHTNRNWYKKMLKCVEIDQMIPFLRPCYVDNQLQKVQQFTKLCAAEADEAKKTEARCALEKQGLSHNVKRAQEELPRRDP